MSGIYIHIPFCKQSCYYCDFHFSTSMKRKKEMVDALCQELVLRKGEVDHSISSIYFGGGTPSLLKIDEFNRITDTIFEHYTVSDDPEITLEANPDDLTKKKIEQLSKSVVNRLSIGVQSFNDMDLKLMNRAHNSKESLDSIKIAKEHFDNISLDLIYGIPGSDQCTWENNIQTVLSFNIQHLSAYALTVEPKTALHRLIERGKIPKIKENTYDVQYQLLLDFMEENDYINYEFSNFGKTGYFSRNNLAYWQGKNYLGIGPSAHSFDGNNRMWNVRNNIQYIKSIVQKSLPLEIETLSINDKYNEYIMTGLRTMWGVSLDNINKKFGEDFRTYLLEQAEKHLMSKTLVMEDETLKISRKGKFLIDGIASDLFMVD